MLPQLVGMPCAVCNERIPSSVDGRFCEVCGNPVHHGCTKSPPGLASNDEVLSVAEERACPRCGCDPSTPVAVQVRGVVLGRRVEAEIAPRVAVMQQNEHRKKLVNGALFAAVLLLGWGVVFLIDPPDDKPGYRLLGFLLVGFGSVFGVLAIVGARSQTAALDRFRGSDRSEKEEPPG